MYNTILMSLVRFMILLIIHRPMQLWKSNYVDFLF